VKARAIQPKLSIILMSGEENAQLGSAKDIIAVSLIKPVDPSQLIDIIHKIVDS
jgi:hypothetical protein